VFDIQDKYSELSQQVTYIDIQIVMTRRMKRVQNALSLQDFLHRQRVLGLFRDMVRSSRQIERQDLREDTLRQIRNEFQKNKNLQDKIGIKSLLLESRKQLSLLKSLSIPEAPLEKEVGVRWPWQR
jgi:hypothetical protein